MKLKTLLVSAVALLCSAGVWAETDVTSTYLTNADFSSGKDGWNGILEDSGTNKNSSFVLVSNQTFGKGSNDNNAEMWNAQNSPLGSGNINQTLSNVPAGVYRLSIKVRSDVKFYLYASIGGVEQHLFSETFIDPMEERSLVFVVNKASDVTIGVKNGESINTYNWIAIDDFKLFREGDISSSVDVTNQIVNWDFTGCSSNNFPGWTISADNGNRTNLGETCVEYWISNAADGAFDYYQNLSSLPKGKYTLSASMWNTTAAYGQGTSVNGECGVYGTSNGTSVFKGVNPDSEGQKLSTFTADAITVTNGNLRLGVKNNTTMGGQWFGVDWIKLSYDPYISVIATDFSSGSEMAAGQWYKFTVASAGDYGFDVIDGVVLTTNGDQALSEATGDALTHEVTLATGTTYYIKSTTTQTVTKTSSPYTYTIGDGAADKTYIQPGNTVTISYTSMTTTNTYTSELDADISGVTFGGEAITVSRTTKGFTFTVPTVTAGTDYTLAIPASVIGYKATSSGTNAAQNITLKTPALLDGTYFFKVENETAAKGKYLSRGLASGTHVTIDAYGLPIQVVTDATNRTTFSPRDTEAYFGHWGTWEISADAGSGWGDAIYFTVTLNDGKYRLHSNKKAANEFFKYNDSDVNNSIISLADDGTGSNSGPIIQWSVETPTQHATAMQALKDAQAAVAAAAAYSADNTKNATLDGISSRSALEGEITRNYQSTAIVSPTYNGDWSFGTDVKEKYQDEAYAEGTAPQTIFSNTVSITEDGLYKLSMQAFYRAGGNERTQAIHDDGADFSPVILFFGTAETQLKSLYDETGLNAEDYVTETTGGAPVEYNGKYYTNGQTNSIVALQHGLYNNEVWLYISGITEPVNYTYGIKYLSYAGNSNAQWCIYSPSSVSIEKYSVVEASNADYTALASAILSAEARTLGFENGEYAPYENIEILSTLDDAKDIRDEDPHIFRLSSDIKDLAETLENNASWKANDGEVNAFCGGDFTKYQTVYNSGDNRNEDYPYGWNLNNGATNRSRIMGGTEGSSNAGLSATSSGKALLLKFNATYGESAGYTMPLKAGKIYKVTFKHGRWAEDHPRITDVVMTDPDGTQITLAPGFQAEVDHCESDASNWFTYTGYFVSTKAGDYKFNLTKRGGNTQMQIAIGDIDLRTASALELSQTGSPAYAAGTYPSVTLDRELSITNWNTLCLPFATPVSDYAAVRELTDIDVVGDHVSITFSSVDGKLTAGKPYLVKGKGESSISATDVAVLTTPASAPSVTKDDATVTYNGIFAPIAAIPQKAGNYVVSSNSLHLVDSEVSLKGYRGYFNVSVPAPVKSLALNFDDADVIKALEAAENEKSVIYNLAGQRLRKAQKGVNIINGKKVLVK